jgi:hypothetical protein
MLFIATARQIAGSAIFSRLRYARARPVLRRRLGLQ